MKKKGLIVATIVMVLVLAVSLTTATYAWFTVSASTSIDGFNLSVSAGNVVNIGLSPTNTWMEGAGPDNFVSGNCSYSGTAGTLTGGWTGSVASLGATIDHTINWGEMEKAVGFSTGENVPTTPTNATFGNTEFADNTGWTGIVKVNGNATAFTTNAELAVANGNGGTDPKVKGDFVYLFMGAQPTKALKAGTNKLYIIVQSASTGTTLGMAAAVHVAVRQHTSAAATTAWTDIDVFSTENPSVSNNYTYSSAKSGCEVELPWELTTAQVSESGASVANGVSTISDAAAYVIELSDWAGTGAAPLDQFEIIVYLAGADSDCIDAAKNGGINIFLYFGAQEAATNSGGGGQQG